MLETARLLLRPMTIADVEPLLAIFADPVVMGSFGGEVFDYEQMVYWVRRNLAHQDRYGYGLFSAVSKEDGELVGDCGLEHTEIHGVPEVEVGYDFKRDYWGRGLATEAATAVRDYAFLELDRERLISLIRLGNVASSRVAEKIGMVQQREITVGDVRYWLYTIARRPPRPQAHRQI